MADTNGEIEQFINNQSTGLPAADVASFVSAFVAALPGVLPGLDPDPTKVVTLQPGDVVGPMFAYNAAASTAALRFYVVSNIVVVPSPHEVSPPVNVFGFMLSSFNKELVVPVVVNGRITGGQWSIQLTFDALDLLRQLNVRALGRPVETAVRP